MGICRLKWYKLQAFVGAVKQLRDNSSLCALQETGRLLKSLGQ